jgi:hypothetical protein
MDDIARDIAGRQAVIEHNEYLVDAVKPPVQIEVHVLRELTGADTQDNSPRAHFHRPYYTTLTHLQSKEDPDALFTLLTPTSAARRDTSECLLPQKSFQSLVPPCDLEFF